ncbi:MAG: MFS transporter, partial [Saccharofermentanales bacterium]
VQSSSFLRDWRFYLFMMMLFLYVGVETGFSGWIVTYLSGIRHFDASAAQSLLSVMWISIIIGRLAVAFYGSRFMKARFLMLEGCGITFAALGMILFTNQGMLVLSVIVLGLSLSAFYGMVVANASYLITRSSRASGMMMAFGSLGASVLPYLAGVFAGMKDIVAGLWVLFAGAGILMLLTILHLTAPKSETAEFE